MPYLCCEFDLTDMCAPLQNATVNRVQAASEGVSGYFSLSWNGSEPVGRRRPFHFLENLNCENSTTDNIVDDDTSNFDCVHRNLIKSFGVANKITKMFGTEQMSSLVLVCMRNIPF